MITEKITIRAHSKAKCELLAHGILSVCPDAKIKMVFPFICVGPIGRSGGVGALGAYCLSSAAPQQEASNRIQQERVKIQEDMAMGARLTKHRFKVK